MLKQMTMFGLSFMVLSLSSAANAQESRWTFTDVTQEAGINFLQGFFQPFGNAIDGESRQIASGVAVGDYDGDGWIDLFMARGEFRHAGLLFRNRGDGTFEEVSLDAGVSKASWRGSGAVFADIDGDGTLDLIVGSIGYQPPVVYINRGDGTFEDVSINSGLDLAAPVYSFSLADMDNDGDLDMVSAHWLFSFRLEFWENNGAGTFTNVTEKSGVSDVLTWAFTPIFVDLNGDGWIDILNTADFATSKVFLNNRDGSYTDVTEASISDENGMGAALADIDNDGLLEWFVTSIWDPNGVAEFNWGVSGNRLYRSLGDGTFDDITDEAGVREGYWGWGACAEDFNNDGFVDLFHVNGFPLAAAAEFHRDPARLFINTHEGNFEERSVEMGIDDQGQGRSAICFDYDNDGDVDVLISNSHARPKLYRNDGEHAGGFLSVTLQGSASNSQGVGAVVHLTADGMTQTRTIKAGGTFAGSGPPVAHFGLGEATTIDALQVVWPTGQTTMLADIAINQAVTVQAPPLRPPAANALIEAVLRLLRDERRTMESSGRERRSIRRALRYLEQARALLIEREPVEALTQIVQATQLLEPIQLRFVQDGLGGLAEIAGLITIGVVDEASTYAEGDRRTEVAVLYMRRAQQAARKGDNPRAIFEFEIACVWARRALDGSCMNPDAVMRVERCP